MSSSLPHSVVYQPLEIPVGNLPAAAGMGSESLAFAEVYEKYAPFIWQSLRRLGVASGDVEDVCQEVFVVVHRKIGAFDHRSSVRTWLYGIALRCSSEYRRRSVRREVPTRELDEQGIAASQAETVELR